MFENGPLAGQQAGGVMSARSLAGVVVLAAIVLAGPIVVAGEPAATAILAAKPDKTPPAKDRSTATPDPLKGPARSAPPTAAPTGPATQALSSTALPPAPGTPLPQVAAPTPRPATTPLTVRPTALTPAAAPSGTAPAEPGAVVGSVDPSTSPDPSASTPGAPGAPGWARETKGPVLAAFGALGILGGSVVVFAAVQRRRRVDEHSEAAASEIPPPFAPTEAQLAALETDPLMAALNRRSGARARTTDPDAPAWVRRMRSQGQSEDRSGEP